MTPLVALLHPSEATVPKRSWPTKSSASPVVAIVIKSICGDESPPANIPRVDDANAIGVLQL